MRPGGQSGRRGARHCPQSGRRFRFRAGLDGVAIPQRLAFSACYPRAEGRNHGIVTVLRGPPISEFLIVGCQHGWLGGLNMIAGEIASEP